MLFSVRCLGLTLTGLHLKIPVISTRSPALQRSTNSSYAQSDTECGVWPAGTESGVSWSLITCLSANVERLCTICMEFGDLQTRRGHSVGSAILPRSMSTLTV